MTNGSTGRKSMCVTERQTNGNWTKGLKYAYLRNIFGQNWPQNLVIQGVPKKIGFRRIALPLIKWPCRGL